MADLKGIANSLIGGKKDDVAALVKAAIDEGVDVGEILTNGLVAGMSVVGKKFKANEFYVPEVLIAARAMNAGMEILQPLLAESNIKPTGIVVLGTVKGDLHDIGKNLVGMMLKGGGFQIEDVGVDVAPEAFIARAKETGAQLIALSALLTTTMPHMKAVVDELAKSGINTKTMIGGAPLTQAYADEIGANGYAPDAASAVDLAKKLVA